MSASAHPWGGPWLCQPNLSWSLEVPALQPNGCLGCSLGTPGAACLLPKPSGCLSLSLGCPWLCPPSLGTLGGVRVPPGPLGGCGVVWGYHLGVLLTAVLRVGRRRAGGDPGLHPEAAVRGAARAAPVPLGMGVLPPTAGVRGDTLGRAVGAGEQPEGTGVVVVLVWNWRVWGGQGTVPPLALGWPAVPPRGSSDLPRAPTPCP